MPAKRTVVENPASSLQPVAAVAAYLNLSRSKVYSMMDVGLLPYVKFGKSRRIRWEHVLQMVERNTVNGDAS